MDRRRRRRRRDAVLAGVSRAWLHNFIEVDYFEVIKRFKVHFYNYIIVFKTRI